MPSSVQTAEPPFIGGRPRATVRVFELHGPGAVRVGRRELPRAGALLRLETTGVCGTDHHLYAGRIDVPTPLLLGHEVIGRLERLPDGHGIRSPRPLAVGDRVLVAPGVPCGACAGCAAGERCVDRPCYGLTMAGERLTGGFAPYMELLPGSRAFHVPPSLAAERAVFAEPMACVLSALRKAFGAGYVPPGRDGLVLGFGVIGLCAAVAIASRGGSATVVEYDATRRALAAELGFHVCATVEEAAAAGALRPRRTAGRDREAPLDAAGARAAETGGAAVAGSPRDPYAIDAIGPAEGPGFPLVVDAAGTPAAFASGLDLLGWGGTLVELGNFADLGSVAIKPSDVCLRDLKVVGSGETYYDDFPPAIELVASTPVALQAAITDVHRFDALEDPSALFTARAAGKAMVSFS
jgi:threonine dehydrogenase-like Zn-dependent dehydrogenase